MSKSELSLSDNPGLFDLLQETLEHINSLYKKKAYQPNQRPGKNILMKVRHQSFKKARPLRDFSKSTVDNLFTYSLRPEHPMYFGIMNPNPLFPAVWGEVVASILNTQLASTASGALAIAYERRVVSWLSKKIGWRGGDGFISTSASESCVVALILALKNRDRNKSVLYVSEDTHKSIQKAAAIVGIKKENIRIVSTSSQSSICPVELAMKVKIDLSKKLQPAAVAATIGTTILGAIDPIARISPICKKHGIHLHIDAAWGGGLLLLPEGKDICRALAAANTLSVDAHKWLGSPLTASIFLTKDKHALFHAFGGESQEYMLMKGAREPYETSPLWSRRFMGLKIYTTLLALGEPGLERVLRKSLSLKEYFVDLCSGSAHWEVIQPSRLPVAVLRARKLNQAQVSVLAGRINSSGRAWITCVKSERLGTVLRIGFPNISSQKEHAKRLFKMLEAGAASARRIG